MSVNYEALHFRPFSVMNAVIGSKQAIGGVWVCLLTVLPKSKALVHS